MTKLMRLPAIAVSALGRVTGPDHGRGGIDPRARLATVIEINAASKRSTESSAMLGAGSSRKKSASRTSALTKPPSARRST